MMFSWKPFLVTGMCWLLSGFLAVGVSALVALSSDYRWDRAFLQLLPSNLCSFFLLSVALAAYISYLLGFQAGIRAHQSGSIPMSPHATTKPTDPPAQNA